MELNDYKAAHRELWDWLANNPGREKDEWPGWEDDPVSGCGRYGGEDIPFFCFMCAWNDKYGSGCASCALTKKYGQPCYVDSPQTGPGIYLQWSTAMGDEGEPDYDEACRLAAEIRDSWEV